MDAYTQIYNELERLGGDGSFSLIPTENLLHGDFATNIALVLAKKKNSTPTECAQELVPLLLSSLNSVVEKIEVAGPGFINFFLEGEVIQKENEREEIEITTKFTGKTILVEHSSPNLFKPFSIGHLMNNIVGEFVARATKVGGANVKTMSFPSDVSLGIAKAMMTVEYDKKELSFFENKNTFEIITYLGEAYVRGVKKCEESADALDRAKTILDKLYEYAGNKNTSNDLIFNKMVTTTKEINEDYFKHVLASVGSHIDIFVYESEAGNVGVEIVKQNTGKVFTKSEEAVIYIPDESRKDLHTAVFINSQGYPTYEAKDIGLLEIKFGGIVSLQAFVPDYSFFITDAEQISHFKIVLDAAQKLGGVWPERVAKSVHVPHGRMLFKGAKMSSRLGGVPLALEVIGAVEDEVREKAGEKIAHLDDAGRKKLERDIALSALRVAVLRSKPGININFDPEASLSFEGDSGPYLLYTHARCSSLLDKGNEEKGYTTKFRSTPPSDLERLLATFDLILKESIETLAPQKLVTYLFKVAQGFNSFYGNTQIISDNKEVSEHNLAIVNRVRSVLRHGLYVLGIEAPNRM